MNKWGKPADYACPRALLRILTVCRIPGTITIVHDIGLIFPLFTDMVP